MKHTPLILSTLLTLAAPLQLTAGLLYWDSNGPTPGAGDAPAGTWGTSAFWSTSELGDLATTGWSPGEAAVFSAGSDGVEAYKVTVSGTQTAGGLTIEEGDVSFAVGVISLGASAIAVNAGAVLSTDSSLRISTTAGSTLAIDGGTLRTTNPAGAGTFLDQDTQIIIGEGGATFSQASVGILNIVQTNTKISGTGSLTKSGVGVLAFAGAAGNYTFTGPVVVNDGELRIRTLSNVLPTTTAMTVNSPGILNLNGLSQQVSSLSGNGKVGTGAGTLTVGDGTDSTFSGTILNVANAGASGVTTGSGKLIKVGAGKLTLGGVNTYTGTFTNNAGTTVVLDDAKLAADTVDVVVNAGSLNFENSLQTVLSLSGTGGTVNLGNSHTLTVNPGTSNKTFAGVISGPGSLTKSGGGTLGLSGASDYSGNTLVSGGVLNVSGTISGSSGVGVLDTATLQLGGTAADRLGNSTPVALTGTAKIVLSGDVTETAGALTVAAGASTFDFGTGTACVFTFADSHSSDWTGGALAITGWSGTPGSGGGSDQLRFGAGGLTATQLAAISFIDPAGLPAGTYTAVLLPSGEVVPPTSAPPPPFETWQQAEFGANATDPAIAGPGADPDFDGNNNLLEYALHGNPISGFPARPFVSGLVDGKLSFAFERDTTRTDVTIRIQSAETLDGQWNDVAVSTNGAAFAVTAPATLQETGAGNVKSVLFTDAQPAGTPPKRFLRFKVEK